MIRRFLVWLFGVWPDAFDESQTRAWYPKKIGDPAMDAYTDWWNENAPIWNRYNRHDYGIGLVAWMDARHYYNVSD